MNVTEMIRERQEQLEERFSVKRIGVFGSAARGEMTEKSDVDVLVEFQPDRVTFDNYMDLKFYLEDLLERDVDLVTIDSLKPRIRDDVLKQAQYA